MLAWRKQQQSGVRYNHLKTITFTTKSTITSTTFSPLSRLNFAYIFFGPNSIIIHLRHYISVSLFAHRRRPLLILLSFVHNPELEPPPLLILSPVSQAVRQLTLQSYILRSSKSHFSLSLHISSTEFNGPPTPLHPFITVCWRILEQVCWCA